MSKVCVSPCAALWQRVLAHATTTTPTRHVNNDTERPHQLLPGRQSKRTSHRTRRTATRTHRRPMPLTHPRSTPPTTAISLLATATPAALLPAATQRRAAQRRASSPLGVLDLRTEGALVRPSPPVGALAVALWAACSAPTAAAPPRRAPAAAVERLGKARRHAPFARPATVRARVGGRIGPLVHGVRRRGQVAEHESGPCALGAHASPEPQAVPPTLRRPSRPRSRRTGPLLSHAERAALARRFAAKRWSMGRTINRRSVAQPSHGHRGQLHCPGAALERPDHAAATFTITPGSGRRRLSSGAAAQTLRWRHFLRPHHHVRRACP